MFSSSSVKIDKELLARVRRVAERAGYSSAEEFIVHVLEKELAKIEDAGTKDELMNRLRSLGYLS